MVKKNIPTGKEPPKETEKEPPKDTGKPEAQSEKKPRRQIDLQKNPFAVVIGSSPKICGVFAKAEDALKWIQDQPVDKQAHCFVGQFFPVKIESKVTLSS